MESAQVYVERRIRFDAARDGWAEWSRRVSIARLIVFLVLVAAVFWLGWPGLDGGVPAGIVAGVAAIGFVGLVVWHERVEARVRWFDLLRTANHEAFARLERRWDDLPVPDHGAVPASHPYARDLNVVGRGSLLHLLGGVCTAHGRGVLERWLLAPAPPDEVRARQAAVEELAPMLDLRQELEVRGRLLGAVTPARFARFLQWAESAPWFSLSPARVVAAWGIPAVTIGLGAAQATGAVSRPWWLLGILAAWLATACWGWRAGTTLEHADPGRALFAQYRDLFRLLHDAPFASPFLAERRRALEVGARPAHEELDRLRRIVEAGYVRHSTLGYFFAQSLLLWDFHTLIRLERWQRAAGARVGEWFTVLGELEAAAALAVLRHDHPDWCRPGVDPAADRFMATALGHPLLPSPAVVRNDVTVGQPGTFLLVTGSNMSGKSTLVRAIGANAVLALAGAPVCASALRLPPVAVHTAIRIEDSLAEGVSFFMAELRRLKQIVDAARDTTPGAPRVLYLLDEILQGTNSAERQVAARRVLSLLLDSPAIGAATTHDLALAATPALQAAAVPVHFRETVVDEPEGQAMHFDYRLRTGLAESVNALRLLEMVGLRG